MTPKQAVDKANEKLIAAQDAIKKMFFEMAYFGEHGGSSNATDYADAMEAVRNLDLSSIEYADEDDE